ncbi:polysaccharide biosynthesis tyrosine autokinase [Photobacterium sp. WH77]|uniref:polysaccharide biosynthesis tyrosine autokinase n=1 Tax=unclassified Photobacterium TaxID=2628852 RepID=UPI001EDBF9CD|nr:MULTISPECIES: polysaccharide biosynthesis tyrosine autokinase [unclassified Photobacterium]MCG2835700.1 polysaccharide biosynthesis tyrosine autokinase [Photobacterium sp. WH77]MCG2843313.1 polysaccharide biosynthesis tyrosine autokinase [Photobacterium sp. WH80]
MTVSQQVSVKQTDSDEIDLGKLFGILLDRRWTIIAITFAFAVAGIAYALLATPIYKADALLQVEEKSNGLSALGEMGDLFSSESSSNTEIEIIRSRMILGKTVDKLNLTTLAEPAALPLLGKGLHRLSGNKDSIAISRFDIPQDTEELVYTLVVDDPDSGTYILFDNEEQKVLSGKVGELATSGEYQLFVSELTTEQAGSEFSISKRSRLDTIQWIQQSLSVSERGKQTGILQLSFTGPDKAQNTAILNDISQNYFLQNVARNSAEAEKSLEFLRGHLPDVKVHLTKAEDELNQFRQANDSIDLGLEAKSTLEVMVTLESQLNELTFKESEISQRFTKEHPAYIALLDKRKTLLGEREKLNRQVQKLPKTQREVLRLTRDVEVNQQIYVQLLNKVQELNILKASTVGNVRILDVAQSYTNAIKPKKALIVILATMLGGMLAVALVLIRAAFHRGVENPDEIEAIGLPVYASIPLSDWQSDMEKKQKTKRQLSVEESLLAVANPADLSIEALRSLRTSLHFAMMDAKNNILMISGPSPGIGKSFVSSNMAAVIAKAGQRVLLIDADMRKGRLEKNMAVTHTPGLSSYLVDKAAIEEIIKQPGVDNLDFIGRGEVPPNPSELLMHSRFKNILDWASDNYDIVIVDTPPILAVTDPAIVGTHAGTTLLVGRFGQNAVKEIEVTKQRFEQNGIEVKGFILNAVLRTAKSHYSGGYYNYSYESN